MMRSNGGRMSGETDDELERIAAEVVAAHAAEVDGGAFPMRSIEALAKAGLLGLLSAGRRTGVCGDLPDHHGIGVFSHPVNVPVGPSGPSSATRTTSRAPSSTDSVPANPLRFVLVKAG